jgi:hypothetical protein
MENVFFLNFSKHELGAIRDVSIFTYVDIDVCPKPTNKMLMLSL